MDKLHDFPAVPHDFDVFELDNIDWSFLAEFQVPLSSDKTSVDKNQVQSTIMDPIAIDAGKSPTEENVFQLSSLHTLCYQPKEVKRGSEVDAYFKIPLYAGLTDNATIIKVVSYGQDAEVLAINNFSNQCPTTKVKCDMSLESKLHVDASWALITDYHVKTKVELYKYLALLSDRMCVSCPNPSSKTQCNSGSFKCQNCINRDGYDFTFAAGFKRWLKCGSCIRHADKL